MPTGVRAGGSVHWITGGSGERPAVLIHCALAHAGSLRPLMAHLGDRLSMTAFDLPGHGRTADWDGRGDMLGATARIAESFCDRPVDLIGHSFGGVAALCLAIQRPDLIRSLTLIEPVFFAAAQAVDPPVFEAYLAAMAPYAAALSGGDRAAAAQAFTAVWGDGDWDRLPEAQRAYAAERIHLIEASVPGLIDDSQALLAPGRLEAVDAPVTLIRGDRSAPIIPVVLKALAARLPQTRQVVIEGAGHMAPITHATEVAAAIRAGL